MQMFSSILYLLWRCFAKNPTFCLHKTNCKFELQQNYFVVTSNAFCSVKICTWSIFFSSEYLFEVFLIGSHKREKKKNFSCCFCLYITFVFVFNIIKEVIIRQSENISTKIEEQIAVELFLHSFISL